MCQIRALEDEDSEDEEKRISNRKDREMLEIFLTNTVHQKILQVMEENIAPMVSKIVEQVLESAIQQYLTRNSGSGIHSSESRNFQLKFLDKISVPVFTGTQIKGQEGTPIKVVLVDAITDQVVKSGPEASAKVKIVVVKGDFDGDKRSNWTREEFKNMIVRDTEGKKSLLTGQVYLDLKEGIGFVGEISFTHNANWMKSAEYRLGAVVEYLSENRIREAITESIIVKDRRMTLYGKSHPPSQFHEVWRLVKIGKGGPFHEILDKKNIKTVKDFLTHYNKDPQWLREILGTAMTAKMWEAIVDHARTCILDKKLHLYFPSSSQKAGVVFNVVGQVMGLISDCRFVPIDKLSEFQKADSHKPVVYALEHMEEVLSFDDETSMNNYLQSFKAPLTGYGYDHAQPSTSGHNTELVPLDDETHMQASSQLRKASLTYYGHDHAQPIISAHNNEVVPSQFWKESVPGYYGHDHAQPSTFAHNNELVPFDDEYPYSSSFETSHFNNGYVQPSSDPWGIGSFLPSLVTTSDLNGYGLQGIENEGLIDGYPLIFQENFFNASFCEKERLQFGDADNSRQCRTSNLEWQGGDLIDVVNGNPLACAVAKAQRRWTKLFSVLRWYSVRKSVALKSVSAERIHSPKRARIY